MDNYEEEKDIVFKIDYLVKNSSRIFQLIVTNDGDTSYVPNFDFAYNVINCKDNQHLTKGHEWEKILEAKLPVIFTNTEFMFEQFRKENQELNDKDISGAALFAQGFYYVYRDLFWEKINPS